MKKIFAPLAPLKKIRLSRKFWPVLGYILVVALVAAAAFWQIWLKEPAGTLSSVNEFAAGADTDDTVPEPAAKEEQEASAEAADESTAVLSLPTEPMIWPVDGSIAAGHHDVYRLGSMLRAHVGVDILAEAGTGVKAAWPGIVEKVAEDPRLGWLVEIRHGGDYLTQYACLAEEPNLTVGDQVAQGEVIGFVGESSMLDATVGSHLHFAIYRQGQALDPLKVISAE
ncbi:MAG: M23 family metallopeptidase [Firmicutes bacterium]|nr:M23 family metallopeptidase [Bacillota bacterium]